MAMDFPVSPVDRLPIFPDEGTSASALMELIGVAGRGGEESANGSRGSMVGGFGQGSCAQFVGGAVCSEESTVREKGDQGSNRAGGRRRRRWCVGCFHRIIRSSSKIPWAVVDSDLAVAHPWRWISPSLPWTGCPSSWMRPLARRR